MQTIWKPHATVAAIIEDQGRFLMVEEVRESKSVFNQPAGHLEPDESLLDAVIRETQEEAAAEFKPEHVTGIYRWIHPQTQSSYLRFAFCGRCISINPEQALDDGIIQTHWLSRDELASQPDRLRSPLVLSCIDDYLSGKRFPLEQLIDIT